MKRIQKIIERAEFLGGVAVEQDNGDYRITIEVFSCHIWGVYTNRGSLRSFGDGRYIGNISIDSNISIDILKWLKCAKILKVLK